MRRRRYIYITQMGRLYRLNVGQWRTLLDIIQNEDEYGLDELGAKDMGPIHNITDWEKDDAEMEKEVEGWL